jgi:hypothetical protein
MLDPVARRVHAATIGEPLLATRLALLLNLARSPGARGEVTSG